MYTFFIKHGKKFRKKSGKDTSVKKTIIPKTNPPKLVEFILVHYILSLFSLFFVKEAKLSKDILEQLAKQRIRNQS